MEQKKPQNKLIADKLKESLRFGIEIEALASTIVKAAPYHCEYGEQIECECSEDDDGNIDCTCDGGGEYEKEMYGAYFYAEEDGSLSSSKEYEKYKALTGEYSSSKYRDNFELITNETFRYCELDTILDNLQSSLKSGGTELLFNASCGAHIHISLPKIDLPDFLSVNQVFTFRRKVFKGMREFFNDKVKFDLWKAYYFRSYAQRITKRNEGERTRDRYSEDEIF